MSNLHRLSDSSKGFDHDLIVKPRLVGLGKRGGHGGRYHQRLLGMAAIHPA
jgi:hypothetical protein